MVYTFLVFISRSSEDHKVIHFNVTFAL